MKAKCPYCGKKITYGVRFLERGSGEHMCKSCKKPSNVVQNKYIWLLFAGCVLISIFILMFYFAYSNDIQHAYNADGSHVNLIKIFFGRYKTVKWIIWEIIPYLIFFFVSPLFINYQMQKKYAYTSTDHIDLGTDFIPPVNDEHPVNTGSTRVIPKVGVTKVNNDYNFEDISSSSGNNGDTRNFNLKDAMTQINPEDYVRSASYRSDAPLKKVERVQPKKIEEPQELYRVKVLREQERQKRELEEHAKNVDKANDKNYSANRKF